MSSVTLHGPLFEGGVPEKVQRAAEDVVRKLTELGVQRLTSAFPQGVPVKTGNYRRNVHPTIQGMQAQIDDSGVIYGPWLEGTSSRNDSTRFKGYSTFRKTSDWLQEQAPDVCKAAAEKLASELGG